MLTIRHGDCRQVLRELPDRSVHCCVTSPPYFGLRDYGTAQWDGGEPDCDHRIWGHAADKPTPGGRGGSMPKQEVIQHQACNKCGAVRIDSQIGLEATPDAYVAEIVAVFREVRRVLRDDGTLWLNLGDSYAGGGTIGRNDTTPEALARRAEKYGTGTGSGSAIGPSGTRVRVTDLKAKDLLGIPWRTAFALQSDGWYLRQDIIWSKPNPMPESVTDRCTKAHEYIFLMSKSARYYYDAEAIAEPANYPRGPGNIEPVKGSSDPFMRTRTGLHNIGPAALRNKRSVWEVASQPFAEAHFATFPPALIEPCILAGCPKGGCVLDPFGGAGTTGMVADRLQRDALLIELNADYAAMAERRLQNDAGMFAELAG